MRVVAEIGQCHMGSVATAIDLAYRAKHAGAFGAKYQLLQPDLIASPAADKYWVDSLGTADQREAFLRAGIIPRSAWKEIAWACEDFGIEFVCTPFDLPAVQELNDLGCKWFKIASGDLTYKQLLQEVAQTRRTIILSTGAAFRDEIHRALDWIGDSPVILLACNLAYPTQAQDANLARIESLRHQFPQCEVGWSDHTSLASAGLAAAALGSSLNEVHFTLDRSAPDVPDHAMALDPQGLAEYVTASNLGEKLRGSAELAPNPSEMPARQGARRSVCAAKDLPENHELSVEDLICLRPGDGVPPWNVEQLVGTRTRRPIAAGTQI